VRIAVASGKGGTGKTTIATSMALAFDVREPPLALPARASESNDSAAVQFLDCDVEAPNAHLFLKPVFEQKQPVNIPIPQVDAERCNHCGRCAEVCQWHAIAVVGKKVLVFPQLCHGCGSCTLACPEDAISEIPNPIGVIEAGPARAGITFARGVLNVGEPMAVPIIRQLKHESTNVQSYELTIIDVPPGTTCPVVESMRSADFVLLVTEPTPFGLHDLRLAVHVAQTLNIPVGVVINRDGVGDSGVDDYCREAKLPILMRIPLDQGIAEGTARGIPLVDVRPEYVEQFRTLYAQMVEIVREQR